SIILKIDQRIDHPQSFIHRTPQRKVIDQLMPDGPLLIDQEKSSISDAVVLFKHMVHTGDLFVDVGNQRVFHSFNASFASGRTQPGKMRKPTVDRASNDLRISFFKFFALFLKSMELCRANESKIERIKEKKNIFS